MGIADKLKDIGENLVDKAGDLGGTLKDKAGDLMEDAKEIKDIATGEGSIGDKAKAAVEAVKDPGKPGE